MEGCKGLGLVPFPGWSGGIHHFSLVQCFVFAIKISFRLEKLLANVVLGLPILCFTHEGVFIT